MKDLDVLHVEICQNIDSTLSNEEIEKLLHAEISTLEEIPIDNIMYGKDLSNEILKNHVESICYTSDTTESHIKLQESTLKFHTYRLTIEPAATETMDSDGDNLPASSHWILPTKEFHHLWETLYFDPDVKENLLRFVKTAMLFSDHNVNANIISWNKVVLLYGPPGTGKTTLCKALAQKIIIHFGHRFSHGEFIEINSHSLFSKWFSESGKLVMKLFSEMKTLLENPQAFICILIDEIESLAHARKSFSNGTEPTDSIRVVNALLTQLDQIKKYPNVLILTTSNLSEAIDLAFIDRADIKQYIPPPSTQAIYKIYTSCLKELMRVNLVEPENILDNASLKKMNFKKTPETKNSLILQSLSSYAIGCSGRTLRKLPFLAHAFYISTKKCTLNNFLQAMYVAFRVNIKQNTDGQEQELPDFFS